MIPWDHESPKCNVRMSLQEEGIAKRVFVDQSVDEWMAM
jgi:hypothetical protein